MHHLEQKLIKTADAYDVVAFDVFDTFLFRDAAAPSDVFVLMEQAGRAPSGFAQKRKEAEALARTPGQEVTLAEIYAQPPLTGIDPQVEIDAEYRIVAPNRELLSAARNLHEKGKKVYAISDMYLSREDVTCMLERCGYDFLDGVCVSSSYGVQKRSGKLYRIFLQENGFSSSQVLFVGNDRRSDIAGAALAGIKGFLIPPPKPLDYYPAAADARQGALQAFLRNRLPQGDRWQTLGFSVVGPLLTAFAVWLHDMPANQRGNLLFLARDMYLVRKIYAALYGTESGYLRVSRRSLCPALLQRPMNEEGLALLADALPRQSMTLEQVLDYCGFASGTMLPGKTMSSKVDLRTRPLSAVVKQQLLAVAALGKTPAGHEVRRQAELVRRYLGQYRLKETPPVLVDIGSGGTTQRILEELCGIQMQGACLACDERLHQGLPPERAQAFLFDGKPATLWYWVGQPLLERLISEPCGATVGYEENNDRIEAVLEKAQAEENILRLQQAALDFAHAWRSGSGWGQPISVQMVTEAYLSLVRDPLMADAEALGGLSVEDGETWFLAAPQPFGVYVRHPKQLAEDFHRSRWKNAFLKRALRLPLPYARLYEMLKSKHGR